jgi:hypothetical protein
MLRIIAPLDLYLKNKDLLVLQLEKNTGKIILRKQELLISDN